MAPDELGGRLPLLAPADLDDEQRRVYDTLSETVVPESEQGGFVARLDDGRFIGPFNALLRAPALADGFGAWTAGVGNADLSDEVRQVVILTVGTAWKADYELYAHVAVARKVGVPEAVIDAVLGGGEPGGVSAEVRAAYRLASAVVTARTVDQQVYEEAIAAFQPAGVVAVLSLVGQYQLVSSILNCFRVPAPDDL